MVTLKDRIGGLETAFMALAAALHEAGVVPASALQRQLATAANQLEKKAPDLKGLLAELDRLRLRLDDVTAAADAAGSKRK